MEHIQQTSHEETEQKKKNVFLFTRLKPYGAGIIVVGAVIIGALFYFKSFFIAATVNGRVITRMSVIERLEKQAGKNILDSLIAEKLVNIEAVKRGIAVSEDEVAAQMNAIRESIAQQGASFEDELARQGLTESDLREQIILQKKVEKILADNVIVSDEEIDAFLTQNQIPVPEGGEQELRERVRTQLRNQKLGEEVTGWLATVRESAKIKYYVEY